MRRSWKEEVAVAVVEKDCDDGNERLFAAATGQWGSEVCMCVLNH